jgi:hypothetical protein
MDWKLSKRDTPQQFPEGTDKKAKEPSVGLPGL